MVAKSWGVERCPAAVVQRISQATKTARRSPPGRSCETRAFLLLVVDNFVVSLDYIISWWRRRFRPARRSAGLACLSRLLLPLLLVERLSSLAEHLRQLFLRRADLGSVVATQCLPRALHCCV